MFTNMLTKNLPDRTKRLVFLASITPRVCATTTFDKPTISKLNQVMALSSQDGALELPIQLSRVIWKSDAGDSVIYPGQGKSGTEAIVERYLEATPKWLRYSDRKQMHDDLCRLIENRDMLLAS